MRRKFILFVASFVAGAVAAAPFAFQKGRGPAVEILRVTAEGHGRPGGILPLRITGSTRSGCIPIVARSMERWIVNEQNEIVLEREPLANVPLVAHEPSPPEAIASGRKKADYKLLDLPLPTGIKPGAWTFNTQASPIYCDGVFGMFAWALGHHPEGAYDIPVFIDPILTASNENPAAAAVQKEAPR